METMYTVLFVIFIALVVLLVFLGLNINFSDIIGRAGSFLVGAGSAFV